MRMDCLSLLHVLRTRIERGDVKKYGVGQDGQDGQDEAGGYAEVELHEDEDKDSR